MCQQQKVRSGKRSKRGDRKDKIRKLRILRQTLSKTKHKQREQQTMKKYHP
jgi:hypothetical protein